MNYTLDNFIKPLTEQDRSIQIYNVRNIVKFTINPFSVSRTNVSNNLLLVNQKSNSVLSIDFRTNAEAKEALRRLQAQIDILKGRVPYSIDKQIENYVNDLPTNTVTIEKSDNILIENIWVESNLIPTGLTYALASDVVSEISATTSHISNSYSFETYEIDLQMVPNNYGTFYEPRLYSSVDSNEIPANGTPYWRLSGNVITFYGGFPSLPVVGPSNPPILKYFKYIGRKGTFNLIGGKTNIIEATGVSNTINLASNIREDNIISVTINGVLIYRWTYVGNDLIIDESRLGYIVEPSDLIRIETNMNPGGDFILI